MTGFASTTRLTEAGMVAFAQATGSRPLRAEAGPLHLAAATLPDCIAAARAAVPEDLHAAGLQVGHEIRLLRPLEPDSDLESRGDAEVRQASAGTFVTVRLRSTAGSATVAEQTATFLFPRAAVGAPADGSRRSGTGRGAGDRAGIGAGVRGPRRRAHPVPDGAAEAYADASGDRQAIHLDDDAARAAGFPRTIVHGLCALTYVVGAVARHTGAAPDRLTFAAARFAAPVFWDDTLRTPVRAGDSPGEHVFSTLNDQGIPVLTHGRVRLDG